MAVELRDYLFANFARSTLAEGISASSTTLRVQSGDGALFPSPDAGAFITDIFTVLLFSLDSTEFEICYCTTRSDDTLTVERGKEGTTALSFAAGAYVVHSVTKGFLDQLATSAPAPSAPVLTGTELTYDYDLDWTAATPGAGDIIREYQLFRSDDSAPFATIASLDGDVLSYTDEDVSLEDTSYDWYVRAVGFLGGAGPASNIVSYGEVEYIDSLCYNDTAPGLTKSFGFPAAAEVGDLLVMAFSTNASINTTLPAGWTKLGQTIGAASFDDDALDPSINAVVLAYRFLQSGDTTWNLTFGAAPTSRLQGCVHAFRGARTTRPIWQMGYSYVDPGASVGFEGFGNKFASAPPMNSLAPGAKLLTVTTVTNGAATDPIPSVTYRTDTPIASNASQQVITAGTARAGVVSAIYNPSEDELENLLPYAHRNLNNWSKTNVTVTDNPVTTTTDISEINVVESAGNRHEVFLNVTLQAGQTYTFQVDEAESSSTSTSFLYLTVDDAGAGGSTKWGATFDATTNQHEQEGTIGTAFTRVYIRRTGLSGSVTALNGGVSVVFTPVVSGSHKIAIGSTRNVSSDIAADATAHTNRNVLWAQLFRGEAIQPNWPEVATDGVAVTGANGLKQRLITGINSSANVPTYALEIIPATRLPSPVTLLNPDMRTIVMTDDKLGVEATVNTGGNATLVASAPILPGDPGGRFYFEVLVGPTFNSAASDRSAIYVTPAWTDRGSGEVVQIAANDGGNYGYRNNGQLETNGVNGSVVDTWTAGDRIGVGIDFVNGQIHFWKFSGSTRGTQRTLTLNASHTDIPLRAALLVNTVVTSAPRQMSANFTGPFVDKPSGYSAYDWLNEVP